MSDKQLKFEEKNLLCATCAKVVLVLSFVPVEDHYTCGNCKLVAMSRKQTPEFHPNK